jgi:hypothetical protein
MNGLIRGRDGGIYGSTTQGNAFSPCIFRFDTVTNTFSRVSSIVAAATLLEGPDGTFYSFEVIQEFRRNRIRFFRVSGGDAEILYELTDGDGEGASRLILGADGAVYGTVARGSSRYWEPETWPTNAFAGGVFRLTLPPPK